MATQKVCDRCEKPLTVKRSRKLNPWIPVDADTLFIYSSKFKRNQREFDLCEDCMESLLVFLNMKKEDRN